MLVLILILCCILQQYYNQSTSIEGILKLFLSKANLRQLIVLCYGHVRRTRSTGDRTSVWAQKLEQ